MIEVGTFEAKNRLSELLSQVEKGETVHITRRGVRVASLVASGNEDQHKSGRELSLVEQCREFRGHVKPGPESIKSLIEEGRR